MSKLPPISAPLRRRWREFRIEYLPLITFGLSVIAAVVLWREFAVPKRFEPANGDSSSLRPLETAQGAMATVAHISVGTSLSNSPPSGYSD